MLRHLCLLTYLILIVSLPTASAATKKTKLKLCHSSEKIIAKRKCKSSETLITPSNAAELFGVSPYGNGSAGDKTVSGADTLDDENMQYENFTIEAGATLSVASGTVIRCRGTFRIDGSLYVTNINDARSIDTNGAVGTALIPTIFSPSVGIATAPAEIGAAGTLASTRFGGEGGLGLSGIAQARNLLHPGLHGGGSGASNSLVSPGDGAGNVTILCKSSIEIGSSGLISAAGDPGSIGAGGGGGGVVILASAGTISHDGTINVSGGFGGSNPGDTEHAAGGGGGGGIVQMIAPSIIDLGTVDVSGGSGAAAYIAGTVSDPIVYGGGGGGASGGDGGNGGSVNTNGSTTASEDGEDGYFIKSIQDPTSLF